jgi:hypothetical protein
MDLGVLQTAKNKACTTSGACLIKILMGYEQASGKQLAGKKLCKKETEF